MIRTNTRILMHNIHVKLVNIEMIVVCQLIMYSVPSHREAGITTLLMLSIMNS